MPFQYINLKFECTYFYSLKKTQVVDILVSNGWLHKHLTGL